jgi:hypothetical protein
LPSRCRDHTFPGRPAGFQDDHLRSRLSGRRRRSRCAPRRGSLLVGSTPHRRPQSVRAPRRDRSYSRDRAHVRAWPLQQRAVRDVVLEYARRNRSEGDTFLPRPCQGVASEHRSTQLKSRAAQQRWHHCGADEGTAGRREAARKAAEAAPTDIPRDLASDHIRRGERVHKRSLQNTFVERSWSIESHPLEIRASAHRDGSQGAEMANLLQE